MQTVDVHIGDSSPLVDFGATFFERVPREAGAQVARKIPGLGARVEAIGAARVSLAEGLGAAHGKVSFVFNFHSPRWTVLERGAAR